MGGKQILYNERYYALPGVRELDIRGLGTINKVFLREWLHRFGAERDCLWRRVVSAVWVERKVVSGDHIGRCSKNY